MQRDINKSKNTKIIHCGSANYLNEVPELKGQLPYDCLFNKRITGAGGTTLALTNSYSYVICVPYVSLITNKIEQINNGNQLYPYKVFGIYAGVTKQQFQRYLSTTDTPKIMVTYDSLGKLCEWINPKDYNILIDEYHCLLTAYSFREEAACSVLNNYKKFKYFTFMTATPLQDEFVLEELKNVDVVEAMWDNIEDVSVIAVKGGKSVSKTLINTIRKFNDGEIAGNAYFYVNSLKIINEMIRKCNLSEENTRVIYSDNNATILFNGIPRGKTTDNPKKINFITSTAFEGCDIYDTEGKTIIVSDANKEHTLLDIKIQIPQIIGRIRNTRYKKRIYHIYSNSKEHELTKLSYDEYNDIVKKGLVQGKGLIDKYNNPKIDEDFKTLISERVAYGGISRLEGIEYIKQNEDGFLTLDMNRHLIALYNYQIVNCTYSTRASIEQAYSEADIKIGNWHVDYSDFEVVPAGNIMTFKEAVTFLKGLLTAQRQEIILTFDERQIEAECYEKYPFLKKAVEVLGIEYIENEAKFDQSNIKRKLITIEPLAAPDDIFYKIYKLITITAVLNVGRFISAADAKLILAKAYKEVGFTKSPTATEINRFFITDDVSCRIDGKKVRGFRIISSKYQRYVQCA